MCRWLAFSGKSVLIQRVLFEPDHSLIDQSLASRSGTTTTNADGFGIGWYGKQDVPALYRETRPAWNDVNLRDLAAHIETPMLLAHVRSATGTAVQQTNCHPFRHGRWLFQHNGQIREFARIKRELMLLVDPALFGSIVGTTDSELMFHLALTLGLEEDPRGGLERMAGLVESVGRANGIEHPLQMTLGLADEERLYSVRYSSDGQSGTLWHSKDVQALVELNPDLADLSPKARLIVSEPITDITAYWEEIPESTFVVVEGETLSEEPFRPAA